MNEQVTQWINEWMKIKGDTDEGMNEGMNKVKAASKYLVLTKLNEWINESIRQWMHKWMINKVKEWLNVRMIGWTN